MGRRREGFTLPELLIVIVTLAVIAAIAVSSARKGRLTRNERVASACLKTLHAAEIDFRSNDRDGNRVNDFWTYDVKGLYALEPAAAADGRILWNPAVKLIDATVAAADNFAAADFEATIREKESVTAAYRSRRAALPLPAAPRSRYWFYALKSDAAEGPYATDTDKSGVRCHHRSQFGFAAYPDDPGAGKSVFMIDTGSTAIRMQGDGSFKTGPSIPPNSFPAAKGGSPDLSAWPEDTVLKSSFSRID